MLGNRVGAPSLLLFVLLGLGCAVVLPTPAGAQPAHPRADSPQLTAPDRLATTSRQPAATQDPADDLEAVRGEVEQVMSDPEFSYKKSWFERFADWLAEQIGKLYPDINAPSGPGASFGGGIGTLLAWVIIAVAAAAVIATIAYSIAKRVRAPKKDTADPTEILIEHRRSAAAWESDAESHERLGEWKEALRDRYRSLIRKLIDTEQLPDTPGRTTGELRSDLDRTTPKASADFDQASLLFELAWYADVPTGAAENKQFTEASAAVLGAEVLQDAQRKNHRAPSEDAVVQV